MKSIRIRAAVVAAFMVVVGVGAAFVDLSAKHGGAARREAATQSVAAAGEALDRELRVVLGELRATAEAHARNDEATRHFASLAAAAAERLELVDAMFLVHSGRVVARHLRHGGSAADDALVEAWSDDAAGPDAAAARQTAVSGPARMASGAPVLLLRVAAGMDSRDSWVVAAVRLDGLLHASGIESLSARGYDYQLVLMSVASPRERLLSNSRALPEAPVRHTTTLHDERLRLAIAPSAGWFDSGRFALHSLLVAIFALAAAWLAFDLLHRFERARRALDVRANRLRAANRRLSDEIVQREELEKQFSHASFHDALTGLPNRRYFTDRLQRSLRRAVRQPGYLVAVILLDFDGYRKLVDSLGHEAGNQLLVQAARRLEACLRPQDLLVVRFDGDEFAILLYDIGSQQAASRAASRLREALTEAFTIDSRSVFVAANFGIALSGPGLEHADELTHAANVALSQAKSDPATRMSMFDPATRERLVTRLQLETDLRRAIEREELRLHFQPIVDLASRRIVGMEVLLRWQHPLEGLLGPARFIGLAEETGLIVPMTRWLLRAACAQAREWRERQAPDFYLSVNLSAADIAQPDLCDDIASILSATGLPAGVLRLEVTESSTIDNVEVASERLARLRALGIPLLLDDFGTGYSSLSYLYRFTFDYIKIDRAFVSRLGPDGQNAGLVRAIVHLAADLGMKAVAEGIETAAAADQLQALGCAYGQGYFFSKPVDATAAAKLLFAATKDLQPA